MRTGTLAAVSLRVCAVNSTWKHCRETLSDDRAMGMPGSNGNFLAHRPLLRMQRRL